MEPSGEPKEQNAEVAEEGPQRMAEGGRTIALDAAMADPGEPIGKEGGGEDKAPVERGDAGDADAHAQDGAEIVQRAGPRPAVCGEIDWPELSVASRAMRQAEGFLAMRRRRP